MSVDPQMMGQMLMQRAQPGQQQSGQPQSGANLLQQILAMQQLKQRMGQLPPPQPGTPPGALAPQALNTPMGPGTNA